MYPEKGISAVIVKTERGAKLIDEIVDCVAYSNNDVAADDVLLHEDPNKRSGLEERRDAVIAQYEALGSRIFDSVLVPKVSLFDRVEKNASAVDAVGRKTFGPIHYTWERA